MIHKVFNPLFGNFDAHCIDEALKISQLLIFKRLASGNGFDNYLGNFAVGNEYFGPALKLLIAAMNMNRLVLVRLKEEYNPKIVKNFRH